jgi:hypothetical protein
MTIILPPRSWWFVSAALVILVLVGCNSKGLVPVEGRITFAAGNPPATGYIYFLPREMSINKRSDPTGPLPATARFETDGNFRGTTFSDGDGIRPGTYEVRIDCSAPPAKVSAEAGHAASGKSLIPKGFQPPDLVVPSSGPRPVRYDLDVK